MNCTWLHRQPTLDEVAAHAAAHPRGDGGLWLLWHYDDHKGRELGPFIDTLRVGPTGVEMWESGQFEPIDHCMRVSRALPVNADGIPVDSVPESVDAATCSDTITTCWCFECLDEPSMGLSNPALQRMIVCPACSNKRCPRSTSHRLECTGSNEPDQEGSRFT